MAGAGYKLFNTGDVLTAAQVNTYLQEQVVMVFANATARTTALSGVLAEGMVSYLKDTDTTEVYNGTSWISFSGDITEVQAGTGITVTSGTGPIPSVALTTPVAATNGGTAQSTYTTGDILYASASNTLSKRAIGTTGQVLTVSGGVPTWAAAAGGGKVLQVVSATYSTQVGVASTTFTDTGLSATITPSATSSKILVLVSQEVYWNRGALDSGGGHRLLRGSTEIFNTSASGFQSFYTYVGGATSTEGATVLPMSYVDSPSTTSATTYKTQIRAYSTGSSGFVRAQQDNASSSIVLLEIGA